VKILLASTASYEPPRGGSTRANRVWLEHLAASGHECRVVCSGAPGRVRVNGVEVRRAEPAALRTALASEIAAFAPDRVLVSSEDAGQTLLVAAEHEAPGRVVYLAHTPQMFPFGPASLNPNTAGTDAVKRAAKVIAIGHYTADSILAHTGRYADIVHPPIYGRPPRVSGTGVGLVNPSAVKGLSIFLALADRFRETVFVALPGWGTTQSDRAQLGARPNIQIVPSCPNIDDFFRHVRVLLAPSLWHEGFGMVVVEAMLRGIPVLASDLGGLPEAKLGVPFLLPVEPIRTYKTQFDELGLPVPTVPEQPVPGWADGLRELLTDADLYARVAADSRAAAERFVADLDPADLERALTDRMRILLVQNSQYYPAYGGGNKSNRLLLEALAAKGHRCRVLTRVSEAGIGEGLIALLRDRGITPSVDAATVTFALSGVEVRTETDLSGLRERWSAEIRRFHPQWVIVSSDDPAQLFLETALEASRGRVVYLGRTTLALPFGPDAALDSPQKTDLLRRVAGIVGVSQYVAQYVSKWSGIPAVSLPISLQGTGPFPCFDNFERGYVTIVNPSAIKGLPIFVELARRCPEYEFAAVPTWGTTEQDVAELRTLPNVTIVPPQDDIDVILRQTRVMVVPSLWAEARSRIVVESLLRGVPVLAADIGGIPEAMMGLDYLLPVNPIQRYKPELDAQMVPVAEVPPQDVDPWARALRELLTDRERYERLARESRGRAMAYVESISIDPFERYLRELQPTREQRTSLAVPAQTAVQNLSIERRALLAARLRERRLAAHAAPLIVRARERVPLSYAQQRMYRVHHADPDHAVYNVPLRLGAEHIDLPALVQRHESLRSSFTAKEQRVHPSAELHVCSGPVDITQPFDLERPPLLRASLSDSKLTLVIHHLIADGWSARIFNEQPKMQYRDWVLWQRQQVESGTWDTQREYWNRQLAGAPSYKPHNRSYRGARIWETVPKISLSFGELFGRWAAVLHTWSGCDDLIIGTPVANRRLAEVENTVGMFTNTLPVRSRHGHPVDVRGALANQDYPSELLDIEIAHLFVLQNAAEDAGDPIDTGKAEYDTRMSITANRCMLQFSFDAMDCGTAERLLDSYAVQLR
jgi:glycosyltransferase involved in cell wall biosynthesis